MVDNWSLAVVGILVVVSILVVVGILAAVDILAVEGIRYWAAAVMDSQRLVIANKPMKAVLDKLSRSALADNLDSSCFKIGTFLFFVKSKFKIYDLYKNLYKNPSF